jgi:hypothetical protein
MSKINNWWQIPKWHSSNLNVFLNLILHFINMMCYEYISIKKMSFAFETKMQYFKSFCLKLTVSRQKTVKPKKLFLKLFHKIVHEFYRITYFLTFAFVEVTQICNPWKHFYNFFAWAYVLIKIHKSKGRKLFVVFV